MPKFMFTGSFTAQGGKGVKAEGGSSRVKAVEALMASVGGSLESYYFSFGADDYVIIGDLPSNEAAASAALLVGASGAVNNRTVVLLTADEVDRAVGISAAYRAPGS